PNGAARPPPPRLSCWVGQARVDPFVNVAPGGERGDGGVQGGHDGRILEHMVRPRDAGGIALGSPTGMTTLLHLDLFLVFVVKAAALLAALGLVWRADVRPSLFWGIAIASALVLCFDLGVLFLL